MGISWLWNWRAPPRGPVQVVLYTRRGCHLCDTAHDLLRREQRRHGFTLTSVDIDADPGLAARFGTCVPVVEINGQVRFRGVVNGVLLRRLLRATV